MSFHQSSLNDHQARVDSDGKVTRIRVDELWKHLSYDSSQSRTDSLSARAAYYQYRRR
jgi:hypothetical protein